MQSLTRQSVYFFFALMIIACSKKVDSKTEVQESNSQELERKDKEKSTPKPASPVPRLNYSDFLGHYYEYAGSFEATFSSLRTKDYFDVRFGTNSLVVMKCTKIGECGDKIALKFKAKDDDQVVFEPSSSSNNFLPSWAFNGDSLLFTSFDQSTEEWKEILYLTYSGQLDESAY